MDTVVTLTAADANSSSKILSSSELWKRPTVTVASPSGEAARPLNGGHSSPVVANGRPPPQPRPRSPLRPASIFLPAARQGRRAGMLVGKQASFLPSFPLGGAARRNRQVAVMAVVAARALRLSTSRLFMEFSYQSYALLLHFTRVLLSKVKF